MAKGASDPRKDGLSREKKLREKFAEVLELPKELVLNLPKITIVGNKDMMIENYKGVMEFDSAVMSIKAGSCIIKITGEGLMIKEITSEDIILSGEIHGLEFTSGYDT